MKKAIVFGIGKNYEVHKNIIPALYDVEIIALTDNDKRKQGTFVDGFRVLPPDNINSLNADIVLITPVDSAGIISQLSNAPPPVIFSSHVDYIKLIRDQINEYLDLNNKVILDVGCGSGWRVKFIANEYNPKYITGIDQDLKWWSTEENCGTNYCIKGGNAEALEFDDNTFDAIYSISTFEHINNIDKALSEIKRVLKPNGRFFTTHNMPIWTSVAGHHFIAENDDWNYEHLKLIPPWGHLYLSEKQMREHLMTVSPSCELTEQIIERIYNSNMNNRKSRTELLTSVMNSGMAIAMYNETVSFNRFYLVHEGFKKSELTKDILNEIARQGYNTDDLGVVGISFCLEKIN